MVDAAENEVRDPSAGEEPGAVPERPAHVVALEMQGAPKRVWIDTDVELAFRTSCDQGCDLSGSTLTVTDEAGSEVARVVLASGEGEAFASGTATIGMPHEAGEHTWHVAFAPAPQAEGATSDVGGTTGEGSEAACDDAACDEPVCHEPVSLDFVLSPEPHETSMSVWDVPSPAVAGAEVCISVGVTCPAGCDLGGQEVVVCNEEGTEVARGALSEKAHGTSNLWRAAVTFAMPETCGLHKWTARYAGADGAHPAADRGFSFSVVADEPTCPVTVHVCAAFGEDALGRANVTVREAGKPPYRGVTGEDGSCVVYVPAGTYTVSASCPRYKPGAVENVEVAESGAEVTLRLSFGPGY